LVGSTPSGRGRSSRTANGYSVRVSNDSDLAIGVGVALRPSCGREMLKVRTFYIVGKEKKLPISEPTRPRFILRVYDFTAKNLVIKKSDALFENF
jgi:hypothetical protein